MTINSNKKNQTEWFVGIRSSVSEFHRNYGVFPYVFTVVISLMILIGWYEETEKSAMEIKKLELIKNSKPTLIYGGNIFYDAHLIKEYKLVRMNETYKVDVLKEGVHVEYLKLSSVKVIEEIK